MPKQNHDEGSATGSNIQKDRSAPAQTSPAQYLRAPGDHANLDPDFLALIACPRCANRPPLRFDEHPVPRFVCVQCSHIYPINDGLPDLRPNGEEIG